MIDACCMLVVPAQERDAPALARLHAAAFAEAWDETALRRLLEAPAARAFVATQGYDTEPVGFVLAFIAVDDAEILTIVVAPDRRRRGVGRLLMRTLIEALREEGAARIFLDVAADDAPAQGLYRALRFKEVGRRRSYYPRVNAAAADGLMLKLELCAPPEDGRSQPPCL
jgi:ribosomal-protein-alanine N-acetyltransferase